MANAIDPIKVKGLVEFQRALKAIEDGAQKQLRVVFNSVAETVAAGARRRVPTRSGKAKGSIRVASSQREARLSEGGARTPYMPWLDYGGNVGVNDTAHRKFEPDGRYVYPAYRRVKGEFETVLMTALRRIADETGVTLDGG